MKYSFKCTCGDVLAVDAEDRESAVLMLKEMMTPEAVADHMAKNHAGQPALTTEQVHMGIEQGVVEGEAG